MKKLGGFLKDKTVITASRLTDNEVDRAILKVTSHKIKIPNPKHMQRLIDATRGEYDTPEHHLPMEQLVAKLEKRLHVRHWVVVLKTLETFHHVQQEGSSKFVEAVCSQPSLFIINQQIKDLSDSPEGHSQTRFIRQYGRFLEDRCTAYRDTKVRVEDLPDEFNNPGIKQALFESTSWRNLLHSLTDVELDGTYVVDNITTLEGVRLLLKDSHKIYAFATKRLLWLIDHLDEMTTEQRKTCSEVYQKFSQEHKRLNDFFEKALQFPELKEGVVSLAPLPDLQSIIEAAGDAPHVAPLPQFDHTTSVLTEELKSEPAQSPPPKSGPAPDDFLGDLLSSTVAPQPKPQPKPAPKAANPFADLFD